VVSFGVAVLGDPRESTSRWPGYGTWKPASIGSLVLFLEKNGSHCCRMGAVQNSPGRHGKSVGVVMGGNRVVIDGELA